MRQSESRFVHIRGLRYHVRRWPAPGAPKIVLLHGWMDVSASFQFVADKPLNLVGHSLGGNVAALYAGVRPGRVAKFANLEGFGMAPTRPEQAPQRYARWLEELRDPPGFRGYESFSELAQRLRKSNPRLSPEKAEFLARHWGREVEGKGVVLRSDPSHKIVNPVLYRYAEVRACWREVKAPVLWVDGAESETRKRLKLGAADIAERRAAFRDLRHVILPEAGHMLHHDQPGALARLLEEFLAR
jgi:pimeloyl-ACP methyl ester carboxylesterase